MPASPVAGRRTWLLHLSRQRRRDRWTATRGHGATMATRATPATMPRTGLDWTGLDREPPVVDAAEWTCPSVQISDRPHTADGHVLDARERRQVYSCECDIDIAGTQAR